MPLDLPAGTNCFIDANIVYYAFVNTPPLTAACRSLITRLQNGEIVGHAAVSVLADAVHKAMLTEASDRWTAQRQGLVAWLGRHPERVTDLSNFADIAQRIGSLKLVCMGLDMPLLAEAAAVSRHYGLLTNDAVIVALMHRHGLSDLVTNDDDFDSIPDLTVWKPR